MDFDGRKIVRILDVEATGFTAPEHQPCEIGFCDILATRTDLAGEPTGWEVIGGYGVLVDPGRPIPPEASAVHKIVDEDVAGALPWDLASIPICTQAFREGAEIIALAAHSAKTERQWIDDNLAGGRPWIDSYKTALRLVAESPVHSVQGLRFYMRPLGIERAVADIAHRAFNDAYVAAFILRDMLNDNAAATIEQMVAWSSEPALQVWCHIGQEWRGHRWTEVDSGFLHWIADRDFNEDVLFTVKHELQRREDEWRKQRAEEVPA